ncbi:MAG: hypothetical protein U0520_03135 [Candidatus Saccharimonadales bacterium]
MRYAKKRTYSWSGPIAYSVGLIASDGCLQKDGRHIDLTSKDTIQLSNFSQALEKNLVIKPKFNGMGQESYRVQLSDVAYYDFLLAAGLTPAKSHTLGSLRIPDAYYPDFLRGVFDGDGTVYAYHDQRWKNSFMYYIGICSASKEFLTYLKEMNCRVLGTKGGSIRHNAKASILAYAKKDSYLLHEAMYSHAGFYFLPRKRKKLEDFIIQDQDGTIIQSCTSGEIGKHASLRG